MARLYTEASDMAKRKYCFNETEIEKLQSEGRGQGAGKDYLPWILAHEINSIGLTTRAPGWKTGRKHHLFSKLEAQYFYFLEWADFVVDIREQFPLDHNSTLTIANDAGINYPWVRKTGYNTVLTTDFLITVVGTDSREKLLARTLKYAKDLRGSEGQGILKKFEIERRYWKELGVDWGIVTDLQIPATLVSNIEDCHEYRDLNSALNFDPQEVAEIESIIERLIPEYPDYKLSSLSARIG